MKKLITTLNVEQLCPGLLIGWILLMVEFSTVLSGYSCKADTYFRQHFDDQLIYLLIYTFYYVVYEKLILEKLSG